MSLDVAILRDSFALIAERNPEITKRFYEIFFEKYPSVRPMFGRRSQREQEAMLTQALVAVLDHLEDSTTLGTILRDVGARHVAYGVKDEMYGWVGDALLTAFAEVLGEDFTPAVRAAWTDAYGAIVGLALEGARTARGEASARAAAQGSSAASSTSMP